LKNIRENDKTKMIPVVILTSSREEKDIIEGYKLGTNAYVVKPIVFNEFIEAVKILGAFWGVINEPPLQN
jgi:DNA-binding response OmpR family regulator